MRLLGTAPTTCLGGTHVAGHESLLSPIRSLADLYGEVLGLNDA